MPVIQTYSNLDNMYFATERKILVNNFRQYELGPDELSKLLFSVYKDEITLIPKCECGELQGRYNLGKICPRCNTTVAETFDSLKPILWIEKFRDDLPFISPFFWTQMRMLLYKKMDAMRWLADTQYNPRNVPPFLHSIKELIGGRGYRNVINNIDKILLYVINNSIFKSNGKDKKAKKLLKLYKENKDLIFSSFLPIPNKRLFIMEISSGGDTYTTTLPADIIDIVRDGVKYANMDPDSKKVENGTAAIISNISKMFMKYVKEKMASKSGLVRKHIYGTRSHFTFRAVITTLPSREDYDVMHVPWLVGPVVYRPHLLNKLMKRGYTYKEASDLLFKAVTKYYPIIDELLQELIDESPYKGLPVLFNRNPSLGQSSINQYYITKFKTDLNDWTISVSLLLAKLFNFDIDGDEEKYSILRTKIIPPIILYEINLTGGENVTSKQHYRKTNQRLQKRNTICNTSRLQPSKRLYRIQTLQAG